MSDLTTSRATPNATSSPALADGPTPPVSPAGPTTDPSGAPAPRASRSRSPESRKVRRTSGTCGPKRSDSSVPDGPMSWWESRLRQRLARIGSTECSLTWKASATPAGRSLSRLVPSMRPIAEIDCGLWPTPTTLASAKNGNNEAGNSAGLVAIRNHAMAMWPTPQHREKGGGEYADPEKARQRLTSGHQVNLQDHVRALWATPMAHEARLGYQRRMGDTKGTQKSLTTEATDALGLGENVRGSSEPMEKPGALNPQFVCWLMGYPPAWDACAPTATRSSRKSRPKSSAPISTDPFS
jgi:hypothetical protein